LSIAFAAVDDKLDEINRARRRITIVDAPALRHGAAKKAANARSVVPHS
jgi:hypothetical protein